MAANVVQHGVEVFSSDGKKLGKVTKFFSAASESAPDDVTGEALPETEPGFDAGSAPSEVGKGSETLAQTIKESVHADSETSGAPIFGEGLPPSGEAPRFGQRVSLGPSDTKYMEVHHGGLLGIGGESLYVPYSAVQLIQDDGSVVLRYTANEATESYRQKPPALDAS